MRQCCGRRSGFKFSEKAGSGSGQKRTGSATLIENANYVKQAVYISNVNPERIGSHLNATFLKTIIIVDNFSCITN